MHIANKTNIVSITTVCKRYRLKPINLASLSTETTCIFSSFFVNLACQGCQLLFFFSSKLHQIDDQYVTSVITLVLCCLNFV